MQSYEPALWRTDLIVFVQNDESHLKKIKTFFNDLDCLFTNRRKSANEKPMCTLIDYMPISKRKLPQHNNTILEIESSLDPKFLNINICLRKSIYTVAHAFNFVNLYQHVYRL